MPTTFEKTWNHLWNYGPDKTSATIQSQNLAWFLKAFLLGQLPTYYNGAGVGSAGPPTGAWKCLYSSGVQSGANAGPGITTITVGSNGAALPQATINVASTTGFPAGGGQFWINISGSLQLITYTGTTGTTFTGCTGGAGTMATGQTVYDPTDRWSANTTVAAGSNAASLPQATVNVASTTNFPSSGSFQIYTSSGLQTVNYTGVTGTSFTGCTGGAGTMSTGGLVYNSLFATGQIVQAAAGSAHNWMVLKSPDSLGPVYFYIDLNNGAASNWSVAWSLTAPTGGSNTARPTSTDEVQQSGWSGLAFTASNTTQHAHGSLTTTGDFTLWISDSNYSTRVAVIFQKLADTKTADLYPYVMMAGSSPFSISPWCAAANTGCRTFSGASIFTGPHLLVPIVNGSANILSTNYLGGHDVVDMLLDDHPLYIWNFSAGAYTLKGRLYDIKGGPGVVAASGPFCEPNPTAPLSVLLGSSNTLGFWFPTYVAPVY